MISKSIAESPLNITSILKNFKYFNKQVYKKEMDLKYEKEKGSK